MMRVPGHTHPGYMDAASQGDDNEMRIQLNDFLEGYEMFYEFDDSSIMLIESLRTLRIMNYAAWIARRWDDPAFKQAFPLV